MNKSRIIKLSTLQQEATLREAMKAIEKGTIGHGFVVDGNNKLVGILTDGDIRRALLKKYEISDKVVLVINKKFTYMKEGDDMEKTLTKLNEAIRVIPIVNKEGKVIDFIKYDSAVRIPIIHPHIKGNEFKYLIDAFLSTWISSSGEYINRFEEKFANFSGCKYGVAVSNGTTALHLAMTALGIGRGDEVILPDFTFAASVNAVLHTGAKPVLVDIEKDFWTIDPSEIRKAITSKTKAIMPVHIYGQPCNMDEINKIAEENNLLVIEDAAEAHGAEFGKKKVGSFGEVGCFSFFANKVITTGEGGMCVTNSEKLYHKMRLLRDHGMSKEKKYWHDEVGFNYRMTNLQAAIGCAQLEKIETILKQREKLEERYRKLFNELSHIDFQKTDPKRKKITWLVSILTKEGERDTHLKNLIDNHVDVRPFFYSLGSMPVYKKYLFSNKNSLNISGRGINLPTHQRVGAFEINKIKNILHI